MRASPAAIHRCAFYGHPKVDLVLLKELVRAPLVSTIWPRRKPP
jgi:hypothetical protein